MSSRNLLILEDDRGLREALVADFNDKGYNVVDAQSLKELNVLTYNFAIIDLRLSAESGLEAIEVLKAHNNECRIVILTGFGSIATAVEAMKLGAINYLTKPATSDQIEEAFGIMNVSDKDARVLDTAKRISLSQNEHEYISYVLAQNAGNISKTARELGLHRQSLQRKLKKKP